jgi:hypothetical protein
MYEPATPYVLSNKEFNEFTRILEALQTPSGYSSVFGKEIRKKKFGGLKSHNYHILMQQSGLSHRTSFGKITSEGRCPDASGRPRVQTNVRVGQPPTDGMSGRPVGRPGGRHLVDGRRTAWRTAIRPPVTRSDRRLDGGRPLRPPVGWLVDSRADGLADPSA